MFGSSPHQPLGTPEALTDETVIQPTEKRVATAWLQRFSGKAVRVRKYFKNPPRPPITMTTVVIYQAHREMTKDECGCTTCTKIREYLAREVQG
jgi:hypothetical protein